MKNRGTRFFTLLLTASLLLTLGTGCKKEEQQTGGQQEERTQLTVTEPQLRQMKTEDEDYQAYVDLMEKRQKETQDYHEAKSHELSKIYDIVRKGNSLYLLNKETNTETLLLEGFDNTKQGYLSYSYDDKIDDTKFVYTVYLESDNPELYKNYPYWGIYDVETNKTAGMPRRSGEDFGKSPFLITETAVYSRYFPKQSKDLEIYNLTKVDITEIKKGNFPESLDKCSVKLMSGLEKSILLKPVDYDLTQDAQYFILLNQEYVSDDTDLKSIEQPTITIYDLTSEQETKSFEIKQLPIPKENRSASAHVYSMRKIKDHEWMVYHYQQREDDTDKFDLAIDYIITMPH